MVVPTIVAQLVQGKHKKPRLSGVFIIFSAVF